MQLTKLILIATISLASNLAYASLFLEEFRAFKCSDGNDYAALVFYHGMGGSRGNNQFLGFCRLETVPGNPIVSFFGRVEDPLRRQACLDETSPEIDFCQTEYLRLNEVKSESKPNNIQVERGVTHGRTSPDESDQKSVPLETVPRTTK